MHDKLEQDWDDFEEWRGLDKWLQRDYGVWMDPTNHLVNPAKGGKET